MAKIFFDARWDGEYGIGRYSNETRARLRGDIHDLRTPDEPLSPKGLASWELATRRASPARGDILLSPSFTPALTWRGPQAITVHDLIHVDVPEESSRVKGLYYNRVVLPLVRKSAVTFTVSEYSKRRIMEWSGVSEDRIIVTGNAADASFTPDGERHTPGYPYILYVRNAKPHKNTHGLLQAFALLPERSEIKLVLSGNADEPSLSLAKELGISDRVVFAGRIPEAQLPAYYRGAELLVFPSLYEGFGIPAVEAMACGTPVVAANATSLPEIVGTAAELVDPKDPEAISAGLHRVLADNTLRTSMRAVGLEQTTKFTWEKVTSRIAKGLQRLE